jgi:hypothetical protein
MQGVLGIYSRDTIRGRAGRTTIGVKVFFSVHKMTGDPDDLMDRKKRHMDPVTDEHAGRFGALWSVTVRQEDGIVTYNLWEAAAGAAEFSRLPEALQAHRESGLPMPSSFDRYESPHVTYYAK